MRIPSLCKTNLIKAQIKDLKMHHKKYILDFHSKYFCVCPTLSSPLHHRMDSTNKFIFIEQVKHHKEKKNDRNGTKS